VVQDISLLLLLLLLPGDGGRGGGERIESGGRHVYRPQTATVAASHRHCVKQAAAWHTHLHPPQKKLFKKLILMIEGLR